MGANVNVDQSFDSKEGDNNGSSFATHPLANGERCASLTGVAGLQHFFLGANSGSQA